jgi:hypothetical protein
MIYDHAHHEMVLEIMVKFRNFKKMISEHELAGGEYVPDLVVEDEDFRVSIEVENSGRRSYQQMLQRLLYYKMKNEKVLFVIRDKGELERYAKIDLQYTHTYFVIYTEFLCQSTRAGMMSLSELQEQKCFCPKADMTELFKNFQK